MKWGEIFTLGSCKEVLNRLTSEKQKEDYPRLPPVKINSEDKLLTINWSGFTTAFKPQGFFFLLSFYITVSCANGFTHLSFLLLRY